MCCSGAKTSKGDDAIHSVRKQRNWLENVEAGPGCAGTEALECSSSYKVRDGFKAEW